MRRLRWWLAATMVVAAACGSPARFVPDAEDVMVQPHDFLGVVVDVQLGVTYRVEPVGWAVGSTGRSSMTVGPANLSLSTGITVEVPANTPGGNACRDLYRPDLMDLAPNEEVDPWDLTQSAAWSDCMVIGALVEGVASWFRILEPVEGEPGLAWTPSLVEITDDYALLEDGLRLPVAPDVRRECDGPLRAMPVPELVMRHPTATKIDVIAGTLASIVCLGVE